MKSLMLLISLFALWSHAQAASFARVGTLGEERLMRLAEIHQQLAHLHDHCGERGFLQITARRLNEKWENTVKQAVYYTNTGVNAPVSGVRARPLDLRDEVGMGHFLADAFTNRVHEVDLDPTDVRLVNAFKAILGTLRGDYKFYHGGHENSLGQPSTYVVVVDLINAELLVLEANRCR